MHLQQVCRALRHHRPRRLRSTAPRCPVVPGQYGSPPVAGQSHTTRAPIGRRWPRSARQVVRPALSSLGRGRAAPRGLAQVVALRSFHWPQVPSAPWIGGLDDQVPPRPQCAPRPARRPSSAELARPAPSVPRCALPSAFRRPPRLATRPCAGAASHGPSALDAALTAAGGARHAQQDGPQDGRERRPRPSEGALRRVSARCSTVGKNGARGGGAPPGPSWVLRAREAGRRRLELLVVPLNVAGGKPRGRGAPRVSISFWARAAGRCCCALHHGRSWLGT